MEFESSPGCFRAFCAKCGSALYWRGTNEPQDKDRVEVWTGTLDQKWLSGEGGKGFELCSPKDGEFWWPNAVKGVTDGGKVGRKFAKGSLSEVMA